MRIAEFSTKNSLLVNLFSGFVLIVGLISVFNLQREAFPNISLDMVVITTPYPGASAEDVEKLVTTPIERELRGISGIKRIVSSSEEGISKINVEIDPEARDTDKVVDDIQRAVDRVRNLPEEIREDPLVTQIEFDEFPVIEVSIAGNFSEAEKRRYAELLEDLILDIQGVATVRRIAWRDPEFWVEVNPNKLFDYHVSIEEVMRALSQHNVTIPGGSVKSNGMEFSIRTVGEFRTPDEVLEVIIRSNDMGHHLRIKDIAQVVETFEDRLYITKVNGKPSVSMVVVKSRAGDIIRVVNSVKKTISDFKESLPEGMDIILTNDLSYYVNRRLGVLRNNGIIGLILVIIVLFLFLDPVPAVVTAIGLPIALFSTFIAMNAFGITINLVTMLGLIIVLGMLVDDGIIVSENVYRHVENGMPIKQAAVQGTSEVILPVTVTILTTCAAFAPLMFMRDLLGRFIRFVPIVVIIALAASAIEAFIILPSHLSDFMKGHQDKRIKKHKTITEKKWFEKFTRLYTFVLDKVLTYRYLVMTGTIALLVGSVFMAVFFMRVVMFTGEGIEEFYIRAEAPKGTSLEKLNELFIPVENLVASLPAQELESFQTYLGAIDRQRGLDPSAREGSHLGQIRVFLTPTQERRRTPQQIVESLRPKLDEIKGFDRLSFYIPQEGPPVGQPIEVNIQGDDFEVLQEIAHKFMDNLNQIEGVLDVDYSYDFGKKQIRVVVNSEKANQYFITIGQVASTVRHAFAGGLATTIKPLRAEEEINVLVRFPDEVRRDLSAFDKLLIPNARGALVPLSAIAHVEETEGIFKINHLGGRRVITVTAQVDQKKTTSLEVNRKLEQSFRDIEEKYPGYTVSYGGEFEDQQRTFRNLLKSFMIAFFMIFIILAALFNSLIQPFIVMMAIPFGLIGVIFGFLLHGRPLSFFAFLGVVGLTGIVVNGSIVFVDFVNKLRQSGKERRASLIEAGRLRLRPVLMTNITTIAGLLSVAYGIGGGDPFLKPMGLSIIWGLLFATGLTLIIIPCIYAITDDFSQKFSRKSTMQGQAEG